MLPVLAVGTATYWTSEHLLAQLETPQQSDSVNLAKAQTTLHQRMPLLLMGTGTLALLAGSLILWLMNRELRPLELIYKVDIKDAKRVVINRMREEWIIASETSE
jgi:hypothetical protein